MMENVLLALRLAYRYARKGFGLIANNAALGSVKFHITPGAGFDLVGLCFCHVTPQTARAYFFDTRTGKILALLPKAGASR
jgi:hypothetical protein